MNAGYCCRAVCALARRPVSFFAIIAMVATTLSGCAGNAPTPAVAIGGQDPEVTGLLEQWTEGDRLVQAGRDDVKEARSLISQGERLLGEGREKVRSGQRAKEEAELGYREKTGEDLPGSE